MFKYCHFGIEENVNENFNGYLDVNSNVLNQKEICI